jgi:hypothetical protein
MWYPTLMCVFYAADLSKMYSVQHGCGEVQENQLGCNLSEGGH